MLLRHIQRCTEEKARRVLQTDDWCVSLHELDTFQQLFTHVELTRQIRSRYMNFGIGYGEFQLFLKLWRATDLLK